MEQLFDRTAPTGWQLQHSGRIFIFRALPGALYFQRINFRCFDRCCGAREEEIHSKFPSQSTIITGLRVFKTRNLMARSATEEMFFSPELHRWFRWRKLPSAAAATAACWRDSRPFHLWIFLILFRCFTLLHQLAHLTCTFVLIDWWLNYDWVTDSVSLRLVSIVYSFTVHAYEENFIKFTCSSPSLFNPFSQFLFASLIFLGSGYSLTHTISDDWWDGKKSALNRWIKAPKWLLIEFTTTWNHHFRPEEKYVYKTLLHKLDLCVRRARRRGKCRLSLTNSGEIKLHNWLLVRFYNRFLRDGKTRAFLI